MTRLAPKFLKSSLHCCFPSQSNRTLCPGAGIVLSRETVFQFRSQAAAKVGSQGDNHSARNLEGEKVSDGVPESGTVNMGSVGSIGAF